MNIFRDIVILSIGAIATTFATTWLILWLDSILTRGNYE